VTLAPPRPPSSDDLEALIREARARQRKRWRVGIALLALVAGAALATDALVPAGHSRAQANQGRPSFGSAPRCNAAQLRVGKARFDGAYTGHLVENLAFTNVSTRSCALRGWPSFEVISAGGRPVAARVGHVRNAPPPQDLGVPARSVALRPGGAASFHVIADDGTGLDGICPVPLPSVRTLVIPPGASRPARGATTMPYCHNPRRLLVLLSPVVGGRLDRYSFQ
jgi:hypothetical protein